LQRERGVIKKYMLKKQRKKGAPIKEHRKKRKKESMTPSKIKARRESQIKECLER
jgi:hypothetical protein